MERPMQSGLTEAWTTRAALRACSPSRYLHSLLSRRLMSRAVPLFVLVATVAGLAGCNHLFHGLNRPAQVEVPISNPFQVGMADPTLVWQQVVDAVDDYF